MVYKLGPEAKIVETGTEDLSNLAVWEEPLVSPLRIWKPTSPPPPPSCTKAGPSREAHWKDFPEALFKWIQDKVEEIQTQYYRMEHITQGTI